MSPVELERAVARIPRVGGSLSGPTLAQTTLSVFRDVPCALLMRKLERCVGFETSSTIPPLCTTALGVEAAASACL